MNLDWDLSIQEYLLSTLLTHYLTQEDERIEVFKEKITEDEDEALRFLDKNLCEASMKYLRVHLYATTIFARTEISR